MKSILFFTGFLIMIQTSIAQDKYVDSLHNVLTQTAKPIDRFSTIVKIAEYNLVLKGGAQDSAVPIRLLQLAQQLKNDSLLAISYNWAGSYLAFSKGDNTGALEYYFKAIPLAEKANDKRRISSLYFDIALVYFVLQNNEEALKNIRKGGENLPALSSPMYKFMLVQYQRNLSKYYLLTGRYDSALHYAQALTETSTALKSLSFEYGALYLNGSTYAKMGDMEMADVYFKKANALTPLIQNSTGRLDFYEIYIRFLLNYKRTNEAYEQSKQLMAWGYQNNNNNVKLSAAGFMQQVFDSLHQTDSAYYYSKMKDNLNASIFSQDNINKTQALAFNDQLRIIEDNAKKVEQLEQRKENIQYALLALGIISFVMLFLLLSHRFITSTRAIEILGVIALLIVFEFLNLLLHPFLERITHHSPLIMLLTLVCIAALLVPLHHRLEKWAIHKLVEKNKAIRLAAARKTIQQLGNSVDEA
jgi:tetratricopeptide (TPR) repeat protein